MGVLIPGSSSAVIIATGDGTGNTSAPTDDPGFGNVGLLGGLSVVYLGNRWVLTANHVCCGDITFGGTPYASVAGSIVRLTSPGGGLADLKVIRLLENPGLPSLDLSATAPGPTDRLIMVGHGRQRGAPYTFLGNDGWYGHLPLVMRWGTNFVASGPSVELDTVALATRFDEIESPGPDDFEAQAIQGDSGGAVFAKLSGAWRLVGIMFATNPIPMTRENFTVVYEDKTYFADLSAYRDEILSIVEQPSCSDGLDDDGDSLTDYPDDPGCTGPLDDSEDDPNLICDDGIDNDNDGLTDFPMDPECLSPMFAAESPSEPSVPGLGLGASAGLMGLLVALGIRAVRRTAG